MLSTCQAYSLLIAYVMLFRWRVQKPYGSCTLFLLYTLHTENPGYPTSRSCKADGRIILLELTHTHTHKTACTYIPSLVQSWKTCWKNSRLSASKKGSLEPSNTKTTQCGTSLRPLSQKNLRDIHHSLEKKEEDVSLAPSRYIPRRDNS